MFYDFEEITEENLAAYFKAYNGKRKVYPDGNYADTICNRSIFSPLTRQRVETEVTTKFTVKDYLNGLTLDRYIEETERLGFYYDLDGNKIYDRDRTSEILLRAKNALEDIIA